MQWSDGEWKWLTLDLLYCTWGFRLDGLNRGTMENILTRITIEADLWVTDPIDVVHPMNECAAYAAMGQNSWESIAKTY